MTMEKHERSTKDLMKATVSEWLGTALEFMDFQLYSLSATLVFHEVLFPESSTVVALILAMGTYGAGYVAHIAGVFIFGKVGDRIGRKKVLFITITMVEVCITLIDVLPTYAQIGVFTLILLVTLRIIQGLGAGAEISGTGTTLAEYASRGKRGIIPSFMAMGTNCGTLSATAIWAFMFFTFGREELLAWGWRISFLASVVVMVLAIWLRMNLKESPAFEKVSDSNQPAAKPAPAGSTLQSESFQLATGLRFSQTGNSGSIQTFLADYLMRTLLFDKAIPTSTLVIGSILGFMIIPFLGWLSDKIGRRVPYIIMNTSAIVLAWPTLSIIVDKSCTPSTIMITLVVVHNCAMLGLFALEDITMTGMFGCKNRFTRMTISEEIGGLAASDFGPVLAGIFCTMTGSWYPIAIMIMAYSMTGLISALKMPEVKDRDLSALRDVAEDQPRVVRAAQPPRSL